MTADTRTTDGHRAIIIISTPSTFRRRFITLGMPHPELPCSFRLRFTEGLPNSTAAYVMFLILHGRQGRAAAHVFSNAYLGVSVCNSGGVAAGSAPSSSPHPRPKDRRRILQARVDRYEISTCSQRDESSISDYDEMIELEEQLSKAAANDGNLTTDLADSGLILTCAPHRGVIVIARLRWRIPGAV
jgi:hypothetical protein